MLCWVCLTPLLFCLSQAYPKRSGKLLTVRQGAVLSYGCGVVWYLATCYWIYATMHRYGGLPAAAAAGVLLLFALYLGLYHALFAVAFIHVRRRLGSNAALLAAPFLWTAVELLRARITGFPWDLLGYTQVDNLWLNRLAAITGTMGLSLVVACVNALWLLRSGAGRSRVQRLAGPVLALIAVMSCEGIGARYKPTPDVTTRTGVLLQDNLSVGEERGPVRESKAALLNSFTDWSLHPVVAGNQPTPQKPPDVIAWAEAPTNFFSADPELRQVAGTLARAARAPVIVDLASAELPATPEDKAKEFASAAFFAANGEYEGRYDKMHLVPFGEYVPYKPLFFFAGHLLDGLDFSPGSERRTFSTEGHTFGVFICYESVFGDEVREFAKAGAQVFVNLSDDGWYGDTSAPWEHLDMVRMRAVENRRWVLRATNTGVTGSIDTHGRVIAVLPRHIRSALAAPFEYNETTTFYTRHGDWLGWLCLIVSMGVLGRAFERNATR